MQLNPQDLAVAIKLSLGPKLTFQQLAESLGLSLSAAHRAVTRCTAAGLLLADRQPNRNGLLEFLLHGVRYAFPADRGRQVRGMPTAHAAPPLSKHIHQGTEPPPVWPDPTGNVRGESFSPLYPGVPTAARADEKLYQCLSLVDAIRGGRARERTLAAKFLTEMLNS
jgi:DNA-binding transcriptional ArsR family regulator